MPEYALTKDGTTIDRIIVASVRPAAFALKPWLWLEVTRLTAETASTVIDTVASTVTITELGPEATPPRKIGSFIEFMNIFPATLQLEIKTACLTDPVMALWYDKALGRKEVNLEAQEMSDGLDYLVGEGLITALYKTEILDWDFNAPGQ